MFSYLIVTFGVSALLTAVGTGIVRWYAVSRSVLDVPNHRSSHSRPTPRGGGLAICLISLGGIAAGWSAGLLSERLAVAVLGGGALVALVGWLDDHGGVRASRRAAVHFLAAIWSVAWLGDSSTLRFGASAWDLGLLGSALAVLMIVWLINLYNFMDGIDGIAAGNAVVVALFGAVIAMRSGDLQLASVITLVAGTSVGFLVWNWPPARIFMGDVGSGFLGYLFGVIVLSSEGRTRAGAAAWLVLLGVFIFDATVTLGRRVARGEQWYAAHRSHAYQRLVQSGRSHLQVTAAVLLLDMVLGAEALAVTSEGIPVSWAVTGTLALLSALYIAIERLHPMPEPQRG